MKTLIALLVFFLYTSAATADIWKSEDPWKKSVELFLDASSLTFYRNDERQPTVSGNVPIIPEIARKQPVSKVLLTQGGSVVLTLAVSTGVNGLNGASIQVTRRKANGTAIGTTIEYTQLGRMPAIPADEDGYLEIVRKQGNNLSNPTKLTLVVARETTLFGTLNAGAIFTAQARKTYSLVGAFDASGNPIPNRSIIIENRNDTDITSTVGGKLYYVFDEHQSNEIRWLEKILSLGLYKEGHTRFGMFLGLAGTSGTPNNYQIGFSIFPDREMTLAFSLGANFAQGETLTSGFKPGDIVSLPNLTNVTRKSWTPGFFFSITFNAPSLGK